MGFVYPTEPMIHCAEAERKAIADAQKIVAIWNARHVSGFYPTIGAGSRPVD